MCGICGIVSSHLSDHEKTEKVRSMVARLGHRGPEFSSHYRFGDAVLGHTRLKIIDVTDASNQPFMNRSRDKGMVYNGECYNFRDLRTSLKKDGIYSQTEGDTEVVFNELAYNGLSALEEIDGMFAVAFWDDNTGTLLLARDRMGIKPLYYTIQQKTLYFASELRALLEVVPEARLSKEGLGEYLAFQSNPSLSTLVEGIEMVPPGGYLTFSPDNSEPSQQGRYYSLSQNLIQSAQSGGSDPSGALSEKLTSAVRKRLVSDVPLGAFLSGGIDSTAIVALMRRVNAGTIKTFTLGFEEQDERPIAKRISEQFDTEHTEVELGSRQIIDMIPEAVNALDVPSGDAINSYLVSRFTREAGITVALSGLGGDELFGGYPSYQLLNSRNRLQLLKLLKAMLRVPLFRKRMANKVGHIGKLEELLNGKLTIHRMVALMRRMFLDNEIVDLGGFYRNGSQSNTDPALDKLADELSVSCNELYYYTQPLLLKDTDQMSMAHALEVRVPLMDPSLWEAAASVPIDNLYPGRSTPKPGLVNHMNGEIPDYVYQRSKQGFILPMDKWIRGDLKEFTSNGLFETPLPNILNRTRIQLMWDDFLHSSNSVSWSRIWTLSVLGHWLHKNPITV